MKRSKKAQKEPKKSLSIVRYDDLGYLKGNAIDLNGIEVSFNSIVLQGGELLTAIRESHEPRSSLDSLIP